MVLSGDLHTALIGLLVSKGTNTSRSDVEAYQAQSSDVDIYDSNVLTVMKENAPEVVVGSKFNLYTDATKAGRAAADASIDLDGLFIELSPNENAVQLGDALGDNNAEPAAIEAAIITKLKTTVVGNLTAVTKRIAGQFHNDSNANINFGNAPNRDADLGGAGTPAVQRSIMFWLALIAGGASEKGAWEVAQTAYPLVAANLNPVIRGADGQKLSAISVAGGGRKYYSFPDGVSPSVTNVAQGTAGAPLTIEFESGPVSSALTLATSAYTAAMHTFIQANAGTTMKKAHARQGFSAGTSTRDNALLAGMFHLGSALTNDWAAPGDKDTDSHRITSEGGLFARNAFSPALSAGIGATYFMKTADSDVNETALAAFPDVMKLIRTGTVGTTLYNLWKDLLLAANVLGEQTLTSGSIVSYRNTELHTFMLWKKLAAEAGVEWTANEYRTLLGGTQAGNYGKINSNTGTIVAQDRTGPISNLVDQLISGYDEFAIFNAVSDITSDDIVQFFRNAAGPSNPNDNVSHTIVTNFITNSVDKATKEYLLANQGLIANALRTIYKAKETASADTEDVYVQKLMNGGNAYTQNAAATNLGYTVQASLITSYLEMKKIMREGNTFRGMGMLDFPWGQTRLNSFVAGGLMRVQGGSQTGAGLYANTAAGELLDTKDVLSVDGASVLVSGVDSTGAALNTSTKIANVFRVFDAIKTALGSGTPLRDILVKTSSTKLEYSIGEARFLASSIAGANVLGADPTLDNIELIESALVNRSDKDSLKSQWAIANGAAAGANIYGAANSHADSLDTMYTIAYNTVGTTTYSQDTKDKVAQALPMAQWEFRHLIANGNVAATPLQQARKPSMSALQNFLEVVHNVAAIRASHDQNTESAAIVDTVRLYGMGQVYSTLGVDPTGVSYFNSSFNAYSSGNGGANNQPGLDFTDKDGGAITDLTSMIAKGTAAMTASINSLINDILVFAYANAAFDLNTALISGLGANANERMISAYLVARGPGQSDIHPENKQLDDDEVETLVQAQNPYNALYKMVYVSYNTSGHILDKEPTRRTIIQRPVQN